jgi:hypothetical protein
VVVSPAVVVGAGEQRGVEFRGGASCPRAWVETDVAAACWSLAWWGRTRGSSSGGASGVVPGGGLLGSSGRGWGSNGRGAALDVLAEDGEVESGVVGFPHGGASRQRAWVETDAAAAAACWRVRRGGAGQQRAAWWVETDDVAAAC